MGHSAATGPALPTEVPGQELPNIDTDEDTELPTPKHAHTHGRMQACTHTRTHTKLCTRKSPGVSVLLFFMRYDDGYLEALAIIDAVL